MKEKLQSIIEQKTTGDEAIVILRSSIIELRDTYNKAQEMSDLINKAENTILYGSEGRPEQKSYR